LPATNTAKATVSSTGAAVDAVRRAPVRALSRATIPTAPRTGQSRTRTSAGTGTTIGASSVAATTTAMAAIRVSDARSDRSSVSAAQPPAATPRAAQTNPHIHRPRVIGRSSTSDRRNASSGPVRAARRAAIPAPSTATNGPVSSPTATGHRCTPIRYVCG
jgi:hypothetical protein